MERISAFHKRGQGRFLGLFVILYFGLIPFTRAQEVEHNYPVGPQTTNCDSLDLSKVASENHIVTIKSTTFRFDQTFKLTRRTGLKGGSFYSCDNKTGYLIIKYNEEEQLFADVEKEQWQELITSRDPEGYYLEKIATGDQNRTE